MNLSDSKLVQPKTMILLALSTSLLAATLVQGASWSEHKFRLTTYGNFDGIPAILATDDGAIRIFWSRSVLGGEDYDLFHTFSFDEGTSWSPQHELITELGHNTGVSAIQTSDGSIWLVWASDRTGNWDIYYKWSSDYGASWINDTRLTFDAGKDLKPSICQLSNGTILLVWGSERTGDYNIFAKASHDGGISWSNSSQLTTNSYNDKTPSLIQTSDDTIWMAWTSESTGNSDIYYKKHNGTSWSENASLTSGPKVDTNPYLFQSHDGLVWIFYCSRNQATSEPTTDDVFYQHSSDGGASWSGQIQYTTDIWNDMWPSVTQRGDTRIWVVWTSDRDGQPDWGNWDIYYGTSIVGDVNEDGVVDVIDLAIVGMAFGTFEGQPGYNPIADITADGVVDLRDVSLITINFGAT